MESQRCLCTRLSTLYISSHLIHSKALWVITPFYIWGHCTSQKLGTLFKVHSKRKGIDLNPGPNNSLPLYYVSLCLFTLSRSLRNHISPFLARNRIKNKTKEEAEEWEEIEQASHNTLYFFFYETMRNPYYLFLQTIL